MGVRLAGNAGRVFSEERQVGNLYRWRLDGVDGDWEAWAEKYRLIEAVQDVVFRFVLGEVEIEAAGRFASDVSADGLVHRETVCAKGDRIWLRQSGSNSRTATGRNSAPI